MKDIQPDKKSDFVADLQKSAYDVEILKKDNSLIDIKGKKETIRCNIRAIAPKKRYGGEEVIWFDLSKNILNNIDYLILLPDETTGFYIIPKATLVEHQEQFYNEGDKYSFELDFANESIWGKINKGYTGLNKILGNEEKVKVLK